MTFFSTAAIMIISVYLVIGLAKDLLCNFFSYGVEYFFLPFIYPFEVPKLVFENYDKIGITRSHIKN